MVMPTSSVLKESVTTLIADFTLGSGRVAVAGCNETF